MLRGPFRSFVVSALGGAFKFSVAIAAFAERSVAATMSSRASFQAARAAAEAAQSRRNTTGAVIVGGFVASVFAYSIAAVAMQDDVITEKEVWRFREERERKQREEAARKG